MDFTSDVDKARNKVFSILITTICTAYKEKKSMRFDGKQDAINHIKSFAGDDLRVEDRGDEVIVSIPNRKEYYEYELKQRDSYSYVPMYKVVRSSESKSGIFWELYMMKNNTWMRMR